MTDKETQRQADEEWLDRRASESMDFKGINLSVLSLHVNDLDRLISMSRKGLEADRYREALEELKKKVFCLYLECSKDVVDDVMESIVKTLEYDSQETHKEDVKS